MKVISGNLKGRNIKGFDILGTRPTMDRVKESIFGMIQSYVEESIVLDLFSGSGNLGIECLSNGAKKVYFNDNNKKCIKTINENLTNFNLLDKSIILNMDCYEALNFFYNKKITFNLIFLDPPYKEHIINDILKIIDEKNLLNERGIVVCELNKRENYLGNQLVLLKERKYGDKEVLIYQKRNFT